MDCGRDLPNPGVVKLVQLLQQKMPVHFISCRHRDADQATRIWLHAQGIWPSGVHLLCGDEEITMKDHSNMKADYVLSMQDQGFNCVLFLDDYPGVYEAMALIGVPCIVVNPLYDGDPMEFYRAGLGSEGMVKALDDVG
jgi:hypothetical protein